MTHDERPPALLSGHDLVLRYGQDTALSRVSMAVRAGQFLSLTGPSGSGKSSLLYCLAGLIEPDEGEVFFQGRPLTGLDEDGRAGVRREHFGFVFQAAELVPELTIAENVALPLEMCAVPARQARRAAHELLDRLEIGELARRRPAQVSGGQAQRAAVARAMVKRPDVLFADEPTGALDEVNGKLVLDALRDLTRQAGTALVLVTHDPAIADRADRRIVLRDGEIRSDGVGAE